MEIHEFSSPTHEFSFTISLDSSSSTTRNLESSQAIDLTPADEIFFRGHLLPLQLLSNLPSISPRASTSSLDDFALPIEKNKSIDSCIWNDCDKTRGHSFSSYEYNKRNGEFPSKVRAKSKSFSLLRIGRRRKESENEEGEKNKKKPRFEMGHFLKRYLRMFSKDRRECTFSAPASMKTSPSNSGILMSNSRPTLHHSNDSSMEELQAAIQSAIAHCKNSIDTTKNLGS